jgi:hypothetical protein
MSTKLHLPDVTLVAVASLNIDQTNAALLHCAQHIEFGAVKMLCSTLPETIDGRIKYLTIPCIDYLGYQRFMIESLNTYVQTSYCLVIQADGFVLDSNRWDNRFLKYDYVGAPWPEVVTITGGGNRSLRLNKNSVGNGGFSLRSKRLLQATSRLRFDRLNFPLKAEDVLICHYLYDDMRAVGIEFAPPKIASLFSIEANCALYGQSFDSVFGFHGKHWLRKALRRTGLKRKRCFDLILRCTA